jgi:hypothetical protein
MGNSVRCTAVILGAGLLLAGSMSTASATRPASEPAGSRASAPVLVDCLRQGQVRPADYILACGDGNSRLDGLHWSHWNATSATASGVNSVNDCDPYCAAGTFHSYEVTVRLDRPRAWPKNPGLEHFTRLQLTFPDARPEGYARVVTYPLVD